MKSSELFDPTSWCALTFQAQRELLAEALRSHLTQSDCVASVWIEAGTTESKYDLTATVETDAGILRSPLWSHARATIFCDPSVHHANREPLAPGYAVEKAAEDINRRLVVPFTLETRGLTVTLTPEEGVERTWTAERALFRNRTAVTREDRVLNAASDLDVRDLLAHFYTGPALRLVGDDDQVFLLPAASEVEGPLISLCSACQKWGEGTASQCPACGAPTEVVVAARPPRR